MNKFKNDIEKTVLPEVFGKPRFRSIRKDLCCFDFDCYNFAFDIVDSANYVSVDIVLRAGANKGKFITLYPQLVNSHKCRLVTLGKEIAFDFLGTIVNREYQRIIQTLPSQVILDRVLYYLDEEHELTKANPIKMYFADGVANFGDFIGPWLASRMTGRPIVNVRGLDSSEGAIFGVGSIVSSINRRHQKAKIWGSGLIKPDNIEAMINNLKLANVDKITAVRGLVTRDILVSHGFLVPEVYGDPALLFSQYYTPKSIVINSKKVIIPHYKHYQFFKNLNLTGYHIVNVGDGVLNVIDQIANADLCISTSMHGLILAQAYGVPWAHLHLDDGLYLIGKDFKFTDFFSTLDQNVIKKSRVNMSDISQDVLDKISQEVTLPSYSKIYNSDALVDAFYQCI